ncbi:MAG: DNA polymerase III subunit delta [Bacteroidaceae bacterium]|jgi:DNA polymerase-3 subunit delta|nr:DNA polymerase III subunit delta [Bacteroidaceae bacterium]MBQ2073095.1 DNA polymerase III subunit delta [Bacteroidaceae bacterium]MBR6846405.1 DNA polymerase III subunit delta [Bacteroidaceae bacterium]
MAAKAGITFDTVAHDVKAGKISPLYCLMGDEPFYIDRLESIITQKVMPESNRDFDMELLYGSDVDGMRVADSCRQFPMLGEKRLVVVREAQQMRAGQDALAAYCQNPMDTTVLVLCHKSGKMDTRKALGKAISANGVIFESKRVYDSALPSFIKGYLKDKGKEIDEKAVQMLVEHVGADLTRMSSELDKLTIAIPEESRVTSAIVEDQTGMSKDFNNYELLGALAEKSKSQAAQIVKYYNNNPRSFALPATLSLMFAFYADLMQAYYSPDKSENGIAEWLGMPNWKVRREIMPAMRNYSGRRVMNILSMIRETDAKGKGVGGCRTAPGELLLELVFAILE